MKNKVLGLAAYFTCAFEKKTYEVQISSVLIIIKFKLGSWQKKKKLAGQRTIRGKEIEVPLAIYVFKIF